MIPLEQRGEVAVEFLGRKVVLCLSVGALARLATALDEHDPVMLFARLLGPSGRGPSFADLGPILQAMSNGEIDASELERLMPNDMTDVLIGDARAVTLAFPEEQKKSAPPETEEARLAREFLSTPGAGWPSA